MPPDEYNQPTDTDALRPRAGDWGAAEPELDYDPDAVPVVYPVATRWCWRCGETAAPVAGRCPWCNTWTDGELPRREPEPVLSLDDDPEDDWHTDAPRYAIPVRRPYLIPPIVIVVLAYAALLGTLIMCAVIVAVRGASTPDEIQEAQAFVEVASTLLTLGALALVWSRSRQKVPDGTMVLAWVTSVPVLFALLCLNLLFFTVLRELLKPLGVVEPERMKMTLATVLLICVQPAIVEELFFRQMTLGVLRKSMNMHLAVWITAAAFAAAHLGNILGMPYLFLVGAFLGYARVYGGLTLAIILHFVHNFAVVAYDAWR
ncbi:abortive infection protein : Abortive infection protein OS=Paludibacter propionicigenes (strain DSM 17365 / JCM 13257 / WB4) GN=Palpr_1700 PE=4 SV=1: Abi [Gemmata massiliana]|uniref:CAAX prenyl protease 2/Lysostaphin resistance protein A-like domain-containing protein n=1 Tax=Gemmata massiliana TaxID=1210884 RepID=A0A6P2DHC6_9BACT|nr:CPBP family intramembrane glutamic endopeptidase [Gemmata massiliana]VTS01092.1 abortive infection protein : Abortive infection protein OS=Paludibacter propionicigenes (strain DSM 17365 / JCM 13257 / WB4) GN=Palpr_1700 PE=4 SV=1: Abi [Gemmata massiliana]